jgi:hypothetical protein
MVLVEWEDSVAPRSSWQSFDEYLWRFDFMWNNRQLNDGDQAVLAGKAAEGTRLVCKSSKND